VKRTYFLIAIAVLQLVVGSITIYGAAVPVQMSQDVRISTGGFHHLQFGILGAGRLAGNLTELQGRSFDLFVFDDRGFSSFVDASNSVPPLFTQNGSNVLFGFDLPGSGEYHMVLVDFPARGALQLHLEIVVTGLKTGETILAIIVLAGGLTLLGASLMMSVWSWRGGSPALDSASEPPERAKDPSDDTRIY